MNLFSIFILVLLSLNGCRAESKAQATISESNQQTHPIIMVGATQFDQYTHLLQGKRVGMVVNQTSVVNEEHLVDALLRKGIDVKKVFAPEHGFRGSADAGEKVINGIDNKTGLPIISLYGKNKKPTVAQLKNLDIVIFDIQDVGARFYTYISTLEYVMEACAEQGTPVLVLDRPNPNGHYIDGPILDLEYRSFVGRQQIPIVHGMTIAEYAQFLNGERLLKNGVQTKLHIVKCKNYTHNTPYELPIAPSPNLPNQQSILLYPSLCLFEGTNVSVGRGTNTQFQVFGSPKYTDGNYHFIPTSMRGAKYPKFEGKQCFGEDLTQTDPQAQLNLSWLIKVHQFHKTHKEDFFLKNNFFDKLAGTKQLRQQLNAGLSEEEIRLSWQDELNAYKAKRKKYLLYQDFE